MSESEKRTNILFLTQAHWGEKLIHLNRIKEFDVYTADISLCKFPEAGSRQSFEINKNGISKALEIVNTNRFQAIIGYYTDIFLLHHFMEQNLIPRLPLVSIALEPGFPQHRQLATAIGASTGRSGLNRLIRSDTSFWFCMTKEFLPQFESSGIPQKRLSYLPACSYTRNLFNPAGETYLKNRPSENHPSALAVQGRILAAGTFNRDYATFVRACREIDEPAFIITHLTDLANTVGKKQVDLMKAELKTAPNVRLLEPVPFETYIDCLRRARMVVVPLLRDNFTTGQLTISDAQRLARPVISTNLPTARDFIEHRRSGLLCEPGNPDSLREQIMTLSSDATLAGTIAKQGRRSEKALSKLAEISFVETLRASTDSNNQML